MTAELSSRVRSVVSATFGIPIAQITEATGAETLETWDSMTQLHLFVALEAEFEISLEPELAAELTTVGAIEATLRELVARQAR